MGLNKGFALAGRIVVVLALLTLCAPASAQHLANPPIGVMFCGEVPGTAHIDITFKDMPNRNATVLHLFTHVYERAGQKEAFVDCPAVAYTYEAASGALSLSGACAAEAKSLIGEHLMIERLDVGAIGVRTKWGIVALPKGTCAARQTSPDGTMGSMTSATSLAGEQECSFYTGTDTPGHFASGTCGGWDAGRGDCVPNPCKTCVAVSSSTFKLPFIVPEQGRCFFIGTAEGSTRTGHSAAVNCTVNGRGQVTYNPRSCTAHSVIPVVACPRVSPMPVGQWFPKHFFDKAATIKVTWGTRTSTTFTSEERRSWSKSASETIKAGFKVKVWSGEFSYAATHAESHDMSTLMSSTLETTHGQEVDYTMPKAGQVWQWQMLIEDTCGQADSLSSFSLVTTSSQLEQPCCLPGYFKDATNPTGQCIGNTQSFCRPAERLEVLYESDHQQFKNMFLLGSAETILGLAALISSIVWCCVCCQIGCPRAAEREHPSAGPVVAVGDPVVTIATYEKM